MSRVLENPKVTLVLVGNFDPTAAMPRKLGAAGVIREDEATSADIKQLIPGQAVEYALGWCSVSIIRNRFAVETSLPPFVMIADLVQKTIGEVMQNPSISQMGINRQFSIKFPSNADRDAFGMSLAPPSAWGKWGQQIDARIRANSANPENHGGVLSIIMRETPIEGRDAGSRDVSVTAVTRTHPPGPPEALVTLTDHFAMTDANQPPGLEPAELANRHTSAMMRILGEQFDKSLNDLEAIAQGIIGVSS